MDLYRYDEAWELDPARAASEFFDGMTPKQGTVLLDLRKPEDFASDHVPHSYNLPLPSLSATTSSPFFEPAVLESQWKELEDMFAKEKVDSYGLVGKNVCVTCYDGDTARVATSVLRAKGITASSVEGGFAGLASQLVHRQHAERDGFVSDVWPEVMQGELWKSKMDAWSPRVDTTEGMPVIAVRP